MISKWLEWMPLMWEGLLITLEVTFLSAIVALIIAVAAGLCRLSRLQWLRGLAYVYMLLFRGVSLLVLLFWVYFVLPFLGIELSKLAAAVLAIGLNYGAFGAEIVRSSILAVPKGQWEAAQALNFTSAQRMIRVVFPQALIRMLPPLNNLMIELMKATSLIYFITLTDLTYQAMILRSLYLPQTAQIFGLLLVLYFVIASVISLLARMLERKLTAGRM
ncbi:ectoine/hydroxyectoine ABC transporter permease subunit EhuC [Paenibacillus sp. GCM10012307]|uniref:Ectoine/hydroxyectoine ABC transporter permease subunit EhuC n=1 Tax=Paenibacillus roseus TaxID=2798579 RepID=A0A934IZZ4_9BACL|nr:ectoine/hydroxyectoine ABC transporter permease subunit EhuC [Paenibacillus roseus]MBJ6362327.1 ectoine/hydroxyectoine ABC transporter permease subunit EhuC [Paenibacillus roseus]